jgi:multidrug efflux pump subunit AcrB
MSRRIQTDKEKKRFFKTSAFTLIVTFICVALMGLSLIPLLPVKLNPSYTLPSLSIQYDMPRASSRVVEREVTSKLEAMLSRMRGIKKIYSNSDNGIGNITVEFDKHVDINVARFEVSTMIRQLWPTLSDQVRYPYIHLKKSEKKASRSFMSYTINAPANPDIIQKYAEEHIKTKLTQVSGLYKIEVRGATRMEWVLEYDTHQLQHLGLSPSDLLQAIRKHYTTLFLGRGNLSSSNEKKWIRLVLEEASEKNRFDPSKIMIRTTRGQLIPLDVLVKVKHQLAAPTSYYRINGLNSIYLFLTAEDTANQLKLNKAVLAKMAQIEKELPVGYELHLNYDATEYIRAELHKIYLRTVITIAILLFFVFIITLNVRYLFLIVVSLAINIAIAVVFYFLFHLEIQLYSLAGITVSLNLIIDNTIVMTDHYLRCRNRKTFIAILAATLTTIGALAIIFFLKAPIRLNLQDFAAVVIVNLAVSLLVALFFVPSLIEKIGLQKKNYKKARFHRLKIALTRIYAKFITFTLRNKKIFFLFFLFAFGLPVFLLPDKIEGEGKLATLYNETLGSTMYRENIKPILDKALGGTLRLFVDEVYDGSYFTRNKETVLSIVATLPNGSTLEQMNALVKRMECYINQFEPVSQYQTIINDAYHANIQLFFKKEYQKGRFPYFLKSKIIEKALELGGGSWSVYGLNDQGFSNDVQENAGGFKVKLYGYNYDELYNWAEQLKAQLLKHRRIREVTIDANFSYWKNDYQEYYLKLNKEQMGQKRIVPNALFSALSTVFGRNIRAGRILTKEGAEDINLISKQSKTDDIWALNHNPIILGKQSYKISDFATIEKGQMPQCIVKENQQYKLCLQYEYIGVSSQGRKILENDLLSFTQKLPLGYSAEAVGSRYSWGEKEYKQYLLLGLVIVILFFITSILFNSLRQPLAVIFVIPVSYIGVFLTFYLFHLNFDQGGFASFILLCGITVNASLYIINEYNAIHRRFPRLSSLRVYTKAWNTKIIPILLTIISTLLGFVPFLIGMEKESFWFPLAAGTIGGLVMSLIGIFLFLPMMIVKNNRK